MTDPTQPPATNGSSDAWQSDTPEPVLGLPSERAVGLLPADLIQGDETIILLLKPSLWYIVLGSLGRLGTIVVVALACLIARGLLDITSYTRADVMALAVLVAALVLIWQFFEWLSRTYVLTDRRVIRVRGVLRVQVFQTELKQLQHTELLFSIRERFFALGTIAFATAGSAFPEAYWVMIRQPLPVHQKVIQAINRYR